MSENETRSDQVHEVFTYLRTRDGVAAIDFYKRVFGAEEQFRLSEPSGRVAHGK